jgi:hypothetical protein
VKTLGHYWRYMKVFCFQKCCYLRLVAILLLIDCFSVAAFAQDAIDEKLAYEIVSSPCFGPTFGRFSRKKNASNSGWILDRRKIANDAGQINAKGGWPLARVVEISDDELTILRASAVKELLSTEEASELVRLCSRNNETMKSVVQKTDRARMNQMLTVISQQQSTVDSNLREIASAFGRQKVEFTEAEKEASKEFSESKLAVVALEKINLRVRPLVASRLEEIAQKRGKDDLFGASGISPEVRKKMLEGE